MRRFFPIFFICFALSTTMNAARAQEAVEEDFGELARLFGQGLSEESASFDLADVDSTPGCSPLIIGDLIGIGEERYEFVDYEDVPGGRVVRIRKFKSRDGINSLKGFGVEIPLSDESSFTIGAGRRRLRDVFTYRGRSSEAGFISFRIVR